jgi:hypothetical protein
MKKLKDILSEVAQPKSAEEKRFKDQHTIELIKHPVALDSQFTGEIEGLESKARPADQTDGKDADAYDQAYAVKDKPFKMPRNIDESRMRFSDLLERVMVNESDMEMISEDPSREVPMMQRQLEFICYAAEEIQQYLSQEGIDPEEWYQNKLANAFSYMKSLHAYAEGEKRVNTVAAAYQYEETEQDNTLEEANFKPGNMKLKDGSSVKLSMDDAKAIAAVMKTLNPKNRKEMEERLMKDKKGFQEIVAFAKTVG